MTGDIKIATVTINGQMRVPPEVMRILHTFAEHRDLCSECKHVFDSKLGSYCTTGNELMKELLAQPEVKFIPHQ